MRLRSRFGFLTSPIMLIEPPKSNQSQERASLCFIEFSKVDREHIAAAPFPGVAAYVRVTSVSKYSSGRTRCLNLERVRVIWNIMHIALDRRTSSSPMFCVQRREVQSDEFMQQESHDLWLWKNVFAQ